MYKNKSSKTQREIFLHIYHIAIDKNEGGIRNTLILPSESYVNFVGDQVWHPKDLISYHIWKHFLPGGF